MRRRLSNTVCLLSLLLAVAVAALWARSVWWATDGLALPRVRPNTVAFFRLVSARGAIIVTLGTAGPIPPHILNTLQSVRPSDIQGPPGRPIVWLPGFQFSTYETEVRVPHWLPLLVLAAGPAWRYVRQRRSGPIGAILCRRCGYDLRGSSGGACPECGEATSGGRAA